MSNRLNVLLHEVARRTLEEPIGHLNEPRTFNVGVGVGVAKMQRAVLAALEGPDTLDAALAEALAALPPAPPHMSGPGAHWFLSIEQECHDEWRAEAYLPDDGDWQSVQATAPTPAAALRALAARLQEAHPDREDGG